MVKIKDQNQIKWGALISYMTIVVNALFGVVVTPFILKHLGSSAYGVYKTMGSLSASLMILDLGIGSTLMRYIAKYRAEKQDGKISPFVSMMMGECALLIPIIVIAEVILYLQLNKMYSGSFTSAELLLAKQIFVIFSVNIIFNVIEHFLHGIISGYNNFAFGNGLKLTVLALRITAIVVLLPITKNALFLVGINLAFALFTTVVQLIYILKNYRLRISFKISTWETAIFKESFFYTFLIFLTTIVAQVNNNLDNVIIGAYLGAEKVTVYSFGLVIFGMFEQLSTAISGVALPTVSKIVAQPDWKQKAQDFVVKMGRVQFILLGAAAVGFAVLGKDFLTLWLGTGYSDVYWIVLVLMTPALFELCVNVCLSILRAKNMLTFRTAVLFFSTVLNLVISVAGIRKWGYISAAAGTAASFIVGSLIIMNIYYRKKLGFNMLKIYARILRGTLPCLLLAGAACYLSSVFVNGSWIAFILNVLVFMAVYSVTMFIFGCSKEEKASVLNIANKFRKKETHNG